MKRLNIFSRFGVVLAGFLCYLPSLAQTLPSSGNWNATTVTTQTVNLTGNINLYGTITIPNGVTLTINSNGSNRTIYNLAATNTSLLHMFYIQHGGKLEILGTSGARISIGGGANFTNPSGDFIEDINALSNPTRTMNGPVILNESGTLQLEYVTIQNVCNVSATNDYFGSGAVCHRTDDFNATAGTPASTTIKHCTFQRLKSFHGVGVFCATYSHGQVTIEDSEFKYCIATTTNMGLHGAVVRGWGSCCCHMNLTQVKIHHCFSNCDCGAIYWPSNGIHEDGNFATLTMNGCEFYNNNAMQNGGALDICGNLRLTGATTKVHDNKCGLYGGGMSVRAYNSGSPAPNAVDVVFDLSSLLEVYNNVAPTGGGIAFQFDDNTTLKTGSTLTVDLDGAKIHDNQATTDNGGGIFMQNDIVKAGYASYFNMDDGEVYNNTANKNGGGIYTSKFTIESNADNGYVKVYNNTAKGSGGGMYIYESSYTMNGGEIYGNKATGADTSTMGAGGGILIYGKQLVTINGGNVHNNEALKGGGLTIESTVVSSGATKLVFSGGNVYDNTASIDGGGIYVYKGYTTDYAGKVMFTGGNVTNNSCSGIGGGVFVNCAATAQFSNGNVQENTAKNGGGIALAKGANLTFSKGKVILNNAVSSTTVQTGYQKTDGSGLGGGVYLVNTTNATNTTKFIISDEDLENVQIYENFASNGADDIFSNGSHTTFSAPDPEGIPLNNGFVSQGWFEDYVNGDTGYANGTHMMGASVQPSNIIRYRQAVRQNIGCYDASSLLTGNYTGYACLTLGYKPVNITVSKIGLKAGESATFDLFDGDGVRCYQIALTGVAGQNSVSKTIVYQPSNQTMKVKETSWGWSYKPKTGTLTEITQNIGSPENRTFIFENEKDTELLHSESIKENVFTYDAAPINPDVMVDPMDFGGEYEVDFD